MEAIFNRQGRVVGWMEEDSILDLNNRHRAFVDDGSVFSYQGRYLGALSSGFFRDKRGHAVAFFDGAEDGPITPIPQIPPIPPIPPIAPIPPIPPIPPIAPIESLSWSSIDWEVFLSGA